MQANISSKENSKELLAKYPTMVLGDETSKELLQKPQHIVEENIFLEQPQCVTVKVTPNMSQRELTVDTISQQLNPDKIKVIGTRQVPSPKDKRENFAEIMKKNHNLIFESDYIMSKQVPYIWQGSGVSTLRDRKHPMAPLITKKRQSSDYGSGFSQRDQKLRTSTRNGVRVSKDSTIKGDYLEDDGETIVIDKATKLSQGDRQQSFKNFLIWQQYQESVK